MMYFFNYLEELENTNIIYFNIENLYVKSNYDNFDEFKNNLLLKYYKKYNKDELVKEENITYKNMENPYEEASYKYIDSNMEIVLPKRYRLIDELASINTITKCINLKSKEKEALEGTIIPRFNELEYIKRYHPELIDLYYLYLRHIAIDQSKKIDGKNMKLDKKRLELILATYVIENNKKYDIKSLNKINANKKDLKMQLVKKGYLL